MTCSTALLRPDPTSTTLSTDKMTAPTTLNPTPPYPPASEVPPTVTAATCHEQLRAPHVRDRTSAETSSMMPTTAHRWPRTPMPLNRRLSRDELAHTCSAAARVRARGPQRGDRVSTGERIHSFCATAEVNGLVCSGCTPATTRTAPQATRTVVARSKPRSFRLLSRDEAPGTLRVIDQDAVTNC